MAQVGFANVRKQFPDGTVAVHDFSLQIADGEFVVLVGPSGCGKSTILRSLAGIERVTSGEITIGERVVNELSPQDRDVAMVFQNYALYANMTVFDNLAFSLRSRKMGGGEVRERVMRAARTLAIEEFLQRKPANLSGGQRQRVAIGRAIVRDPAAFLMDEPLSNLDAKLRGQMRAELTLLHRELSSTVLYVTHDQVEAMTMGDRVAVMWRGVIQQADEPAVLYERPGNLFVANFIGSPSMNFLRATVSADGDGMVARAGSAQIALGPEWVAAHAGLRGHTGREVVLGVRPEHLTLAGPGAGDGDGTAVLDVDIDVVENLGNEKLAYFRADAPRASGVADGMLEEATGEVGSVRMAFCARLDPEAPVREGRGRLAFDPRRLHVFDADSGATLRGAPAPAPAAVAV
jgi:multiple sugar transport system ATP-binding protein